jgi:hypothetical protein
LTASQYHRKHERAITLCGNHPHDFSTPYCLQLSYAKIPQHKQLLYVVVIELWEVI